MQIAFALYDYYRFGGLQEDCLATAKKTAARGHEVHIFCRTWKGEIPDEMTVHELGRRGWSNTGRNKIFFSDLKKAVQALNPDGLVAFNRIPGADIYFAADPCYLKRVEDRSIFYRLSFRHRHYAELEKAIFKSKDPPLTLVLTAREIEHFIHYYGCDQEQFIELPPGIERQQFVKSIQADNRCSLRKELNTPEDSVVALFVGSGFRVKGLDRALRAIRANQQEALRLEFWCVGNGKASEYRSLAKSTGHTIRFLGGRADVDRFYDAADFLLHPAYSESAGKVLLEALTHGLPVLTTDTCGYAPHIEQAKAGKVIGSPFSQKALNSAVREFVRNTAQRADMQQNALAYAAHEDLYSCHETAAKIIEAKLKRKQPRSE
ncbi:glucosyltransferase I RfaG [Coraliomargarita sinensis]|uniref:Glucosyltransferase I RfaG n=1 Tax=Coraliomargarita sinensis TaxID=2174842 RepID=A0A317ZFG7_9BACT|nr:glycosyltransferase family 4 protein [Coraliomargarita sinensis]PXA03107.1 glucosyltransferase I RfaG [Coraliomargarita sinensis]